VPVVAVVVAALLFALIAADPAVAASRYTVVAHDTLFSIALRFHVPLPLLAQINGIQDPSRLRIGQVLIIPDVARDTADRRPAARATATTPRHDAPRARPRSEKPRAPRDQAQQTAPPASRAAHSASYVVRRGDSLYRLAIMHHTTVHDLEAMNGLVSPMLRVGQVLRVPEPPAPPAAAVAHAVPPAVRAAAVPAVVHPVPAAAAVPVPAPAAPTARPAAPEQIAGRPSSAADNVLSHESPAAAGYADGRGAFEPLPGPDSTPGPAGGRTPDEWSPRAPRAAARTALVSRVRQTALGYIGVPYRWGGRTTAGVDCSGLVYAVYSPYVANLPRTSYEQWKVGVLVDRGDLDVGDLVFFNTDGSGASHVGIYIGEGQFVHPTEKAQRVVVDRLDAPYYLSHYIGARRVL
jgi:peptidoglycan endopeptidase LytE